MYLTSFIHREGLFNITGRWLSGRLEPDDGLRITQILICDGFVVGETLEATTNLLLGMIHEKPLRKEHIYFKGELRDAICHGPESTTPRSDETVNNSSSPVDERMSIQ